MDYLFDFLLIVHLLSFGLGAAAVIGGPIVMSRMATATPDGRQLLIGIAGRLGLGARVALGLLVLSGASMVWLRYGGVDGLGVWFAIKMVLVVVLIAGAFLRGRVNANVLGWVTRLSFLGVVIAAVLAFS